MYTVDKCVFAFNIWDIDSTQAIMDAACENKCNVILQTSSRIFETMEHKVVRNFVTYYSKKTGIKAYLHLDHCRNVGLAKRAVDIGWDSVMLDASALPLDENIRLTKALCSYAHSKGKAVEAEVGSIQGVEENVSSDNEKIADINEIRKFLKETDVDFFAAAIGTRHGLYKNPPNIRYELIDEIFQITDKPFVVHGGSGLSDEEIMKLLLHPNVKKINISTELKQAYRNGIINAEKKKLLEQDGFEVTNVKKEIYAAIKEMAANKMRLLNKG